MVTSVSESFYRSLEPQPELHELSEFGLTVKSATDTELPFIGYIKADISVPFLSNFECCIPLLVVPDTDYNVKVPIIVGTNIIRLFKETEAAGEIPEAWQTAFDSLCIDEGIPVRTTNKYAIRIGPNETKTIHGIARRDENVQTAVTEHTDTSLSGGIVICPRLVSVKPNKQVSRVPVRVCNLSARVVHIPPRSKLCKLQSVQIVDSWTPDPSRVPESEGSKSTDILDTLGVKIDSSTITHEECDQGKEILTKWSHIFSTGPTDLGDTDLVEHEIHLTDNIPFKDPCRRIPPGIFEEVRQNLNEMLSVGAIRPSQSPYSSNVVLVRKKDGALRFCIDFRKLNARTVRDAYSLPNIDDSFDRLIGFKYFSKLDLRSGYWQVRIREEEKAKTAFTVSGLGFYECNRMAFGFTNAPATFQRLIERCMGEMNLRDCLIFLDDILIFSRNFEDHLSKLEAVFSRLHKHGLKLKASKCEFFKDSVTYLGHIVSSRGIETDPEKLKALSDWPVPHDVKSLRTFLGFTGYYRRFVKDYSKVVKPLNDLLAGHGSTRKGQKGKKPKAKPWCWGESQQIAFDRIKQLLCSPPVLAYADYSKPFILHTDASGDGLGAVLYQIQNGKERVISYASRGLHNSERNYPAHKLEFLCLKWAVTEKFHDYLYGNTFQVVTDNNPLTYVLTTAKLDATGHRWLVSLSNYSFKLSFRSGAANRDADGLSRRPHTQTELFPDMVKAVCHSGMVSRQDFAYVENLVTSPSQLHGMSDESQSDVIGTTMTQVDWSKEQRSDATLGRIYDLIQCGFCPRGDAVKGETPEVCRYFREWKKLSLKDGVLYRSTTLNGEDIVQLVLPSSYKAFVLRSLHDDLGHQGRDRTLYLVRSRFYWPGQESDVEKYVGQCGRCIRRKTLPRPSAELVSITSSQPMELVCIDFLSLERSKGGYEDILVITDHFTRYAQAIPTRNKSAKVTAKALFENFIVHYGFPAKLHSDQAQNFEGHVIKELCRLAGIKKTRTTPYHPMGNGTCERFNSSLLSMLATLTDEQKVDWKSFVAPLVHAYNATRHDSTKYSPYYLMFGRHPRLAIDAYFGLLSQEDAQHQSTGHYATQLGKRLDYAYKVASREAEKSASRHKARYDLKVRESTVDVNDRVLVRNVGLKGKHKLADRWSRDVYIVISQPNKDIPVYRVQSECGGPVRTLHRNMLLPFSAISISSDLLDTSSSQETVPKQPRTRSKRRKTSISVSSSESESDSDDDVVIPYFVPIHGVSEGTVSENTVSHVSDTSNVHSATETYHISNIVETSIDASQSQSPSGNPPEPETLGGIPEPEQVDHSNTPEPELPRRSGRVRKPPNRYGEWIADGKMQVWYV